VHSSLISLKNYQEEMNSTKTSEKEWRKKIKKMD